MGQSTDQIRQEIDQKRDDAAGKIDQLETQVKDTADQLKSGVQDTTEQIIDQVKGTVEDSVETVKQSVQNVDFRQQIEERPLVALGVALVGGFVLGGMMGGGGQQQSSSGGQRGSSQSGSSMSSGIRSVVQNTGLEDTFSNAASALVGSLTDQVKDTIDRSFPGFADRMQTTKETPGGFVQKTREVQKTM